MSVEEHSQSYLNALHGARLAERHVSEWLAGGTERLLLRDSIEQQLDATKLTAADLMAAFGTEPVDSEVALLNMQEGYTFAVFALNHLIQHDDRADHEWWLLNRAQWKRLCDYYLQQAEWAVAEMNRAQGLEQVINWMKRTYEAQKQFVIDAAFCAAMLSNPAISLTEAHRASIELHTYTSRDELIIGWLLGVTILQGLVRRTGGFTVIDADTYRLFNITWTAQIALAWRRPV
jgi:hypothetical protein